jgi:hypothetical protein
MVLQYNYSGMLSLASSLSSATWGSPTQKIELNALVDAALVLLPTERAENHRPVLEWIIPGISRRTGLAAGAFFVG